MLLLALLGLLIAAAAIETIAAQSVHPFPEIRKRPPTTRDAGLRNVELRRRPYDWSEHGD